MAPAPTLSPALPTATYQYPTEVVELRNHASSISKKVDDPKSKPDSTPRQICAHALSITEAIESACAGQSLVVLEPFVAVAVEEIVRLFSSCCLALDAASRKPRFGAKLTALTSRAISRSRSPSPSPGESTSLDDYRVSLEAVKVLLRIDNGQSQLVSRGTIAPLTPQSPALLHSEISNSTVVNQVFKTALQTMMNITDGLPFPYKAVAQTVLQLHEHIESYRQIDGSIKALMSKIDDFVRIVARSGGRKINSREEAAEAIEAFFRAVQSIIVHLEILKATRQVKKSAAPAAVAAAVAEGEKKLDHARNLLNTSIQFHVQNTVDEIRDRQILAESDVNYTSQLPASPIVVSLPYPRTSDVNYTSQLPASPKRLHGRDQELRSLVGFATDRSRPVRLAIMGTGGLGKTTLAKAVVQHIDVARTFRDRRFFVTAETAGGVDDLLTGMLTTFHLPATSDPLESLLQHFSSHDQTLLVLDNLETIWNSANAKQRCMTEAVLSQLDAVSDLTLIITCRGADLPPDIAWANRDTVVLTTLSPEAALAMFTDIAGDVPASDQPVRDALLREVDYMPLAVTLLARLVARGKQLRDLDRRWNSVHTSMLRTQPNGRLDNVNASIQLSIAYLPSDDPAPLQLLSLCALLPDGMRLSVRNEIERLCGFEDVEGILDVIHGLALVYVTDDHTIRMLSPIRLYVLEKHIPQAAHRASLLRVYYEIASHAPRDVETQSSATRDKIMPELRNLNAIISSEIRKSRNLGEPLSIDLINAANAVSQFSVYTSIQLSIAYLLSDGPAPLQLLSLCAQLPDGMRLLVRNEIERLCGLDGVLDVIEGLELVYVTDDETVRMLSPIRFYVLEQHRPAAAHRACLLRIYYDIAGQAPRHVDTRFPAARDRILPELRNLDALLLSEIQNFDEPPSTDLIDAVNAVSGFSLLNVPNERLLMALIPRIEHLPKYLADSLGILADLHWRRGAYGLSLEAATRAQTLYQSLGRRPEAAYCDLQMANVHRLKGNYPEAIASLSAARETFNDLDNQLDVAFCDRELALLAYDQEDYDDAAVLFTSAREVFLRLDEPAAAAYCQEHLGDIHRIRADYLAAEMQLESALQTYVSLGSLADIASCSCSLGDMYRRQQRFDAALERLQVAYDISQKQGDTLRITQALQFRSYVHRDQGQFAQARRLLLDAKRLYESIDSTRGLEQCAEALDELDKDEQA